MKTFKILVSLFCVTALLVGCFSFSAAALVFNDGDFGYEMNGFTKEMTLVQYNGSDEVITIPGYYNQYPVTAISKTALGGNQTMQVVNVPITLKKIGDGAYNNCTALSTVRFPSFVSAVGKQVCLNCTALESAMIDSLIAELPEYTFAGCTSLTDVSLSSSVTSIGAYAFQDCSSLKKIDFLSQIHSIGRNAFEGTGIEELTIPDGITEIPNYAFANCANLTDVTIPNQVNEISTTAFVNSNITIHCYYESNAYHYAKDNNIPYKLLDEIKLGDVNMDSYVNISDVTVIQQRLAELEVFNELQEFAADTNQDGAVDVSDATTVQMFLAEYDIPNPIGVMVTQ